MPGLTYTIADLIREQGRIRADALQQQAYLRAEQQRQSGAALGQTIAGIGQTIANLPAQRRQQQMQAQQDQVNALKLEEMRGELADKATARQRMAAFQSVLNKHDNIDDAVNDPELMKADPELYSELMQKHVLPARKAAEDERTRKNNFIASQLGSAEDQGTWTKAKYTVGQVYPDAVADLPEDFEQAKPIIKTKLRAQLSPKDQLEQMQKEQTPKGFTNETQLYAAAADPKHPQHDVAVAALELRKTEPKGAALGSFEDYVSRTYGPDATPAQILAARKAYGQADDRQRITVNTGDKLVKVEHKDPATGRTVIEWLPQSSLAGQKFEKGTSATTETRLASAQAVNQTGEDIIAQLSDPKIARMLGPAMGRYNNLRDFIGNPPPELSEIAGSIESYALANMGVHGMRSAQGAEQIKKLLDQKHTPASLIATIRGLNKFSSHFMENEGRKTGGSDAEGGTPGAWIDLGGGIKVRKK